MGKIQFNRGVKTFTHNRVKMVFDRWCNRMRVYVLNRKKNIENNTSTPFSLLGLYAKV